MNKYKLEQNIFYIAIFFLPSAFLISAILLLINLFISFLRNAKGFIKDKWNYPFLIGSLLMIISCFLNSYNDLNFVINLNGNLSWIGLFNWIPMFLLFWGLQPYLDSEKKRYYTALYLIIGTFPVFITAFGQYWFGWTGNDGAALFNIGGLIIWSQRPLAEGEGMSGLFNNPNYLGSWMNIILPFCLELFLNKKRNIKKKIILAIFSSLSIVVLIFTKSRNAILGFLINIILLCSKSLTLYLAPFAFLSFLFIGLNVLQFIPTNFFDGIFNINIRFEIWGNAIKFLFEKPLFGWGPSVFSKLYEIDYFSNNWPYIDGSWYSHAHNAFIDLSLNYGLITATLITSTIMYLLFKVLKENMILEKSKIKISFNSFVDKAWFISAIVFITTQLFDFYYYDGRISIIFWILLAGLRCQIKGKKFKKII